jgi:ribosome biogenesis GTPase
MKLKELGYHPKLEAWRKNHGLEGFLVGRVSAVYRERYAVITEEGEFDSELLGNLRFTAASKEDLPAVGDWVALSVFDEGKALIHALFPRATILVRQAVGSFGEKQLIAANVDEAWIVQAVNRDFSLNRLERYLSLCYLAKIRPLVLLTKTDLLEEDALSALLEMVRKRMPDVGVMAVSNVSGQGINALKQQIVAGRTYCLLGSSGVGKSSLINTLSGEARMEIGSISASSDRGRHITTHRALILLEGGGMLIDNPGMREVGLTEGEEGVAQVFDSILSLADQCRFSDCTHSTEAGCAVLDALERGEIDESSLENYHKMQREQARFTTTQLEKRQRDKQLGKIFKEGKAFRKKRKY